MKELPMGFAMALGNDPEAMKIFAAMPQEKQNVIIERAASARSREEMRRLTGEIKTFI